eukprot:scaffold288570_cov15-Tisochrysis_lutea.AAC.1
MPSLAAVQQAQSLFSNLGMPADGAAAKTSAESSSAAAAAGPATPPESPARPSAGGATAFGGGKAPTALA